MLSTAGSFAASIGYPIFAGLGDWSGLDATALAAVAAWLTMAAIDERYPVLRTLWSAVVG